ncbi:MAG: hypothetical protein RLZZ367_546 [Bacteroidota bacterium]|jgi:hypothetical protein
MPSFNIYLIIYADSLDFLKISESIGVLPTNSWHKGDAIPNRTITRKESCWEYCTGYVESHHFEDVFISKILTVFDAKKGELVKLCDDQSAKIKIDVVVKMDTVSVPSICLDEKILTFLNSIQATIDFDMYVTEKKD